MCPTTSWSTLVTANTTMLDPASGSPNRHRARALLLSEPHRLRGERHEQDSRSDRTAHPADRQAHRAESLPGEPERHRYAKPAVHLVGNRLAVLAEIPLHQ